MSKFEYRRFKIFNQELLLTDLHGIDFSFVQNAELGADAAYDIFESQISRVVNRHGPIKQAYQRKKKLSCMNGSPKKLFF